MGCIANGIALCGERQFKDAMRAFDLAFMFVDANIHKTHLLLLIKATYMPSVRPSPCLMQINMMKQFCASKA
jgi:hypothetical protein